MLLSYVHVALVVPDTSISLPSTPTVPTGYTFGGWKVRPSGFDLSTLAQYISDNGSAYAYIRNNGQSSGTRKTPDAYSLTTAGEWATEFSYGTVKGIARCSLVGEGETMGNTGNPTDDYDPNNTDNGAIYCWCQAPGYDAEKDGTYQSVGASSWVFFHGIGNAAICAINCANGCGDSVQRNSAFRGALFGVTQ